MAERRVVATGVGVICALGRDKDEFWSSLCRGTCGIGPIDCVDSSRLRFKNGAQVWGYNSEEYFPDGLASKLDRFAQFALIAAKEASEDAGLEWTDKLRERSGVITGSCTGGQTSEDQEFENLYSRNRSRLHPLTIPRVMGNAGASLISIDLGIRGPVFTLTTACSSASHAIGLSFSMLRTGTLDLVLAGGSEAPFSLGNLKAWEAMRVVAPDTCRPFARGRKGMILGEGAAILVMETLEHAEARGARIYAEVVGLGMSSDAHHLTQPSEEGPMRAIIAALADGRLGPDEVAYINAHGSGTLVNDRTEARVIKAVFNTCATNLMVSSTKSAHGHALGAAGAIEAAATILTIYEGIVPPTVNFTEADPDCNLDIVPNTARVARVEVALSNSFAFGGLNVVLAFRRFKR